MNIVNNMFEKTYWISGDIQVLEQQSYM